MKKRPYIIAEKAQLYCSKRCISSDGNYIFQRRLAIRQDPADKAVIALNIIPGHIVLDRTAGSEKPIDEVYVRERPFGLKKLYSSRLIPPRLHFIRRPLRSSAVRSNTAGVAADKFFSDTEADVDSV